MRGFLAIPITGETQNQLLQQIQMLSKKYPDEHIRWFTPEKLHLTLYFFHAISETQLTSLYNNIEAMCQTLKPFEIEPDALIPLPSKKYCRVLAYTVKDSQALNKLAAQVRNIVEAQGFDAPEYAFHPHISIARLTPTLKIDWPNQSIKTKSQQVDSIAFYESVLSKPSSVYTVLNHFSFAKDCE